MTLSEPPREILDVLPPTELHRIIRRDREHERHLNRPFSVQDIPAPARERYFSSRGTNQHGIPRDQAHV